MSCGVTMSFKYFIIIIISYFKYFTMKHISNIKMCTGARKIYKKAQFYLMVNPWFSVGLHKL